MNSQSGVMNPNVIDLIASNDELNICTLVIIEHREWDSSPNILIDIQSKVNAYLTFVLDGQMVEKYPELKNMSVSFQFRCGSPPTDTNAKFIDILTDRLQEYNILFEVKLDSKLHSPH